MVSSQANIWNTFFDQRSQQVGLLPWRKQTDQQTDGHGDSMTESAQRANSVKWQRVQVNIEK